MPTTALLPPEDLAIQLGNIETVLSVYGGQDSTEEGKGLANANPQNEDELVMSKADEAAIRDLARFLALPLNKLGDAESTALRDSLPSHVVLGLRIDPTQAEQSSGGRSGTILEARFPLRRPEESKAISAHAKEHPLWPSWTLQKLPDTSTTQYDRLCHHGVEAAEQVRKSLSQAKDEAGANGESQLEGDDGASYILSIAEALTEALLDVDMEKRS